MKPGGAMGGAMGGQRGERPVREGEDPLGNMPPGEIPQGEMPAGDRLLGGMQRGERQGDGNPGELRANVKDTTMNEQDMIKETITIGISLSLAAGLLIYLSVRKY